MKKSELINAIAHASSPAVTKAQVDGVLIALGAVTHQALKSGGEVVIPSLGKLSTTQRAARSGRNPQTGAVIEIPAATVAKFTATKALKEALN